MAIVGQNSERSASSSSKLRMKVHSEESEEKARGGVST